MKIKIIIILLLVLLLSFSLPASANESLWDKETQPYSGKLNATVYRSPSCNCCGGWIEHLRKHGFEIEDIKTDDIEAIKQMHGVPKQLSSCHTALIDGYIIEGHVPTDDIKRFLKDKPNMVGLSVPQMPVGIPGMEVEDRKDPFSVISFNKKGETQVFKEYQFY